MNAVNEAIKPLLFVEGFDRETYSGKTFDAVVKQMRKAAWGGDKSDGIKGYMQQVAKRVLDWSGAHIPSENAEDFLQALAKEGLIRLRRGDTPLKLGE